MEAEYQILFLEKPDDAVWEVVGGGIQSFNLLHAGNEAYKRLCYALYSPDQSVAGGVIAEMLWDWLYINLLFIKEELRGHGFGSRLLASIEAEARSRGARHAYLDTFSFQAPEFYLKHGYRVFGELQNFPPGHQRYFLTKELSE